MFRVLPLVLILLLPFQLHGRETPLELQLLHQIRTGVFFEQKRTDYRCKNQENYTIYLIDNFDEYHSIIPELSLSHGQIVQALVESGSSNNFTIIPINTALSRGLAQVLNRLQNGDCADAVISSIPGSNYTYGQLTSLLNNKKELTEYNILESRESLLTLLRKIALRGFPSVRWLEQIDINSVKLKEDARKILFIDTLGLMQVPVILPYGNNDNAYNKQIRGINILSLSKNAKVYSGVDAKGDKLPNYPYSPLSTGNGQAKFSLVECPDYDNLLIAHIDINDDGFRDFSYRRSNFIPYYSSKGDLRFSPPPLSEKRVQKILKDDAPHNCAGLQKNLSNSVITGSQYATLQKKYPNCITKLPEKKQFIWFKSEENVPFFFIPQCQNRGVISGTSLIPPLKVKELLLSHSQNMVNE